MALEVPCASTSRISLYRSGTSLGGGATRTICKHGVKCYRRNPEHLKAECHPYDDDYLDACRETGTKPIFVSIRSLFYWCDPNGSGKAKRDDIQQVWSTIREYGTDVPELSDEVWGEIDDDGNGYVNFSEFAEFTTMMKIGLPLGLDELINCNGETKLRCGVIDCNCSDFSERKRRCKYGDKCYQTAEEHLSQYCHPADADWGGSKTGPSDSNMCSCGHKRQLHKSSAEGAASVPYPEYWVSMTEDASDFNVQVEVDASEVAKFQQLLNLTYSDKTTRDRANHSGTWMVPRDFTISSVVRNENSKLWRKYCVRKAELAREKQAEQENPELAKETGLEYDLFEVETSKALQETAINEEPLNTEINEWYLFHGTSASAASNICQNDFKMRLAGSATGTLYGRGSYLAESITKGDEYSKLEGGANTVLLCRVLGGRVKYCAEREPDPNALTNACVQGPFDCIVGDRKKISGTYREFVVFDAENVYPEYILRYKRGELFKSDSFPGFAGAK